MISRSTQILGTILVGLCIMPGLIMNLSLFYAYVMALLGIAIILSIGYMIASLRNITRKNKT